MLSLGQQKKVSQKHKLADTTGDEPAAEEGIARKPRATGLIKQSEGQSSAKERMDSNPEEPDG